MLGGSVSVRGSGQQVVGSRRKVGALASDPSALAPGRGASPTELGWGSLELAIGLALDLGRGRGALLEGEGNGDGGGLGRG